MRKTLPSSVPQKAPPSAPAPRMCLSWRTRGRLLSGNQTTVAASWTTIAPWSRSALSRSSPWSAPYGVGKRQTVSDDTVILSQPSGCEDLAERVLLLLVHVREEQLGGPGVGERVLDLVHDGVRRHHEQCGRARGDLVP